MIKSFIFICLLLSLLLVLVLSGEENVETKPHVDEDNRRKQRQQGNSTSSSNYSEDENLRRKYEEDVKAKQAEARRMQKQQERKRTGRAIAKRTIQDSLSDVCDWKSKPLSIVKGELCGSHYKVLGLDRKRDNISKADLKKLYRKLSLTVHPDKNPSAEAQSAFKVLQDAYECLSDDVCKENFDQQLSIGEQRIIWDRQRIKENIKAQALNVLSKTHYYASLAANKVYVTGIEVWETVGEWQITAFGEEWQVGQPILIGLLLWKGRWLLQLHALSYVILRINYELARSRGLL